MKYFLHDSNAFNDEKISELFIQHGYEGLGLFYTVLEKLALQEKPIKTSVLKHQLKVGKKLDKCWNFMESLGIISSNNGDTFSKQLLNNNEKYQIKKEKTAERVSKWRENQEVTENVTRYNNSCNAPKEKVIKEKVSKENTYVECVREEIIKEVEIFELSIEVLKFFGFNEIANPNKLRYIMAFVEKQKKSGGFNYFKTQFNNYGGYKKFSGENKHNITTFLGQQSEQFEDGKWDEANWGQKIIDFNTRTNGNSKTIRTGATSSASQRDELDELARQSTSFLQHVGGSGVQ